MEFVAKYYIMNPDEENLLFAVDLEDGMRVLVEDNFQRSDVDFYMKDPEASHNKQALPTLMKFNRWCKVDNFFVDEGDRVSFIGIYDDGTKFTHRSDGNSGWLVKLDSMPESL